VVGRRIAILASVVGLFALAFAGAAAAAVPVETVQNGNDKGEGSLRAALGSVDPGGTVVIPASVPFVDLDQEILLDKSVTIEGVGAGQTAIVGFGLTRLFSIYGGAEVTFKALELKSGSSESAVEAGGGAIFQESGTLTILDSLLDGNHAKSAKVAKGAAIFTTRNVSAVTLRNTVVTQNVSEGGSVTEGGALYIEAPTLTIEGGKIEDNLAEGKEAIGGGLYYTGPRLSISHAGIVHNTVRTSGSSAQGYGGGLVIGTGTDNLLEGDTIAHNKLIEQNGLAENVNESGGGIAFFSPGTTAIVNSTVAENSVQATVKSGAVTIGGGLYGRSGTIALRSSTVFHNSTLGGNTKGGNIASQIGSTFTLQDTLIAEGESSSFAGDCYAVGGGNIVSEGHNMGSEGSCPLFAPGDQITVENPAGPSQLGDNGGPLETVKLALGVAPAIGAGGSPAAGDCPPVDERGVLRLGACDIGAYQVASPRTTTGAARDVGTDTATLAGNAANPETGGGTVYFEYGTATGYGAQTAPQPLAATTPSADFSTGVSGLQPNTTYHYRSVVTNPLEKLFGEDRTFTTAAAPKLTNVVIKVAAPKPAVTLKRVGELAFRVHCTDGPCNGNIVVIAHARTHGRGERREVVVAKAKLRLADGQTKKVATPLTPNGKLLTARPGKLPVGAFADVGSLRIPSQPRHFKLG
jgi:hypothetical protein